MSEARAGLICACYCCMTHCAKHGNVGQLDDGPELWQVEAVADTNGAGDTFATAYMLAQAARWPSPGTFANWAASRAVMMPQACKPHCVQHALHANSTFAQVSKWLSAQVGVPPLGSCQHAATWNSR